MTSSTTLLDFSVLNHIALGIARGRVNAEAPPHCSASALGPLAEAISVTTPRKGSRFAALSWIELGQFQNLVDDVRAGVTREQATGVTTGWIAADRIEKKTHWTGFLMRVSSVVKTAGFDDHSKSAIMATYGEFRSNVIEHAGDLCGSFAAFHLSEAALEILVSDLGRGVLDSLREHPAHTQLDDHGSALKLAVSRGVSRHSDPQRGNGFSFLFEGLANRFNHIRLRSGDHALDVNRSGAGAPSERTSQAAHIPGLLVYARFDR